MTIYDFEAEKQWITQQIKNIKQAEIDWNIGKISIERQSQQLILKNRYDINIYEKYLDLKNSGKNSEDLSNNDLWKIFEYFTCIKLIDKYNSPFYEYDDIDCDYKESKRMTRNDTGIDVCNMIDTIVQ